MTVRARAIVGIPDAVLDQIAERVLARMGPAESSAWLGVTEAAEYLCCSKHRLYRLCSEGRMPVEHEGGRLLFCRDELDAWVRAGGAR